MGVKVGGNGIGKVTLKIYNDEKTIGKIYYGSNEVYTSESPTPPAQTWLFRINVGDYCTQVNFRVGVSTTSVASSTTLEIPVGETITIISASHTVDPNYIYSSAQGLGTFSEGTDSTTVYFTRTPATYPFYLRAGHYIREGEVTEYEEGIYMYYQIDNGNKVYTQEDESVNVPTGSTIKYGGSLRIQASGVATGREGDYYLGETTSTGEVEISYDPDNYNTPFYIEE